MDRSRRRSPNPTPDPARPTVYRIRVSGHLDDRWADSHEGLIVARERGGDTVLTVPIVDQAALHGLLRKLRDLGAPLVSINPAGLDLPRISAREVRER
jgi:hypothetical protein